MLTALLLALTLRLPNPALTPGATRDLSLQTICTTRWGLDRRAVTVRMKKHVAKAYGLPWSQRGTVEFDHLIPRSLGGADTVANLWAEPLWEARHVKDPLEVKLWRMTCAGKITLTEAQHAIATDWTAALKTYGGR